IRPGSEVEWIPEEIPATSVLVRPINIVHRVVDGPRLRALQGHDGIKLPALQHLGERLPSRNRIGQGESEAMPNIVVAAGIFLLGMGAVLWQELVLVGRRIVEGMR